jgi:hypothetical protein
MSFYTFKEEYLKIEKKDLIKSVYIECNSLKLRLKKTNDIFYFSVLNKSLKFFDLYENDTVDISFNMDCINCNVKIYLKFYDKNHKKLGIKSFNVKSGFNIFTFEKIPNSNFFELLFRIEIIKNSILHLEKMKINIFNKRDKYILNYIADETGRKLTYRLNLCEQPYGKPLLVILHGHNANMTKFSYENWNVLSPHDCFGYNNEGSWWLGENGDFFVKDLLQILIKEIASKYQSQNNIYFYGSSMGGYGAILHGILSNAKAVYANVPQIHLIGSNYFKFYLTKNINNAFGKNNPDNYIENNLINMIEKYYKKINTVFFLCENMLNTNNIAYDNYLQEHTLSFATKCINLQQPIHLELLPQSGHTKNYGLKEVIQKFERILKKDINA